jgi:PDZ domain-containing protein
VASLQLPSIDRIPGGRGFASLSRRVRTLIVAAVLFLILFVLALTLPVPYVILSPGPTYNTLGTDSFGNVIIKIDGKTPNKTSGHLNMTTVSVTSQPISAFQAVTGWLLNDEVVVPRTAVYEPGKSQKQTDQQNTQDFITSQDSAKVAALCELGFPKAFGVVTVRADGPSHGVLLPGDQLVSVAGRPADTSAKLTAVLQTQKPGTKVPVVVKRQVKGSSGIKTANLEVTLTTPPKGEKGARLGIEVSETCLAPFSVDLGLANQIGGPSAGLMFALGIMDKVGSVDLTKGRFIAGTGTIDASGKVGAIGGIALKMIAAKNKGASVFLAPADNCADVVKATPAGLKVVKVDTLHHAVQDLINIEKGQSVPGC